MNDRDESTDMWAEVVAAVEYLREGVRPTLTAWEVLEEAIRGWLATEDDHRTVELAWTDPDPLRSAIELLFQQIGSAGAYGGVSIATVFASALRDWLDEINGAVNEGMPFSSAITMAPVSHRWLRFANQHM